MLLVRLICYIFEYKHLENSFQQKFSQSGDYYSMPRM